ncbi:MAG: prephenate dehydrogenase [Armatimonadota bacterium]
MSFQHCSIIGLGLLGGSLALDLRQQFPEMALTGIARRQATLEEAAAMRCGVAPVFTQLTDDPGAVRDADLVVLCTPVQTILEQLAQLAPLLSPGTVITDVGSTKRMIMNAATLVLPPGVIFVGGHPMAGSHQVGLSYARTGLYAGATWALCVPEGAEEVADRLGAVIRQIGACPLPIDPDTHDDLVALTSHLPHVVAAALTNAVLGHAYGDAILPFIAGGFRDGTRVAAASPVMWRDICLTNRAHLISALDQLLAELTQWRDALRAGDAPHLEALLTTAQLQRERLNTP